MTDCSDEALATEIEQIGQEAGAEEVALAFYDYRNGRDFSYHGSEWFHAASTIKVPVLIGVFDAIERGVLTPDARVHVRNRFLSAADSTYYRVTPSRDAENLVHLRVGQMMRVAELARRMIVTSSNLATNLLIDLVGIDELRATLDRLGSTGIDLRRGVEDEAAFEKGINNRVTADGLLHALRLIEERALSRDSSDAMLDILHDQQFRSGIPAGLPDSARVANKTGEISTVAHDVGLVYPADREPYALALLTRWAPDATRGRREALAELSRVVYRALTGEEVDA